MIRLEGGQIDDAVVAIGINLKIAIGYAHQIAHDQLPTAEGPEANPFPVEASQVGQTVQNQAAAGSLRLPGRRNTASSLTDSRHRHHSTCDCKQSCGAVQICQATQDGRSTRLSESVQAEELSHRDIPTSPAIDLHGSTIRQLWHQNGTIVVGEKAHDAGGGLISLEG